MEFKNIHENFKQMMEERKEKLKTNPRYDIDVMADEKGEIRIYFSSVYEMNKYLNGEATVGSTERFFDADPFLSIPKERIEKLTDGRTIAHISAINGG